MPIKKIVKYVLVFLLAVLLIGLLVGYIYLKNSAPKYKGEIDLASIQKDTEVYFDDFGIPHIYAQNAEDAYRALGYVHAQERLFQMEMIRRLSSGQLAEILGPDLLSTDKYFRTLGLRNMAEKTAAKYLNIPKEDWQKEAFAYLEGVNEYIDKGKTPLEYSIIGIPKKHFTPVDIYSTLAYMGLGFSTAIREDHLWGQMKDKYGIQYSKIWFPNDTIKTEIDNTVEALSSVSELDIERHMKKAGVPLWYGSNGWVLSSKKSKSGSVILANDTHIAVSQPSVWYEAHLNFPGFNFYGNYLAGVPFGVIGHNRQLGWGLTIFPFDNMDMYREKRNPKNSNELLYNNDYYPIESRTETIKVKDQQSVEYTIQFSKHGPIINDVITSVDDVTKDPVSLWWTYLQSTSPALETIRNLGRAKNMYEARSAVSMIDYLGLNVLYGDKDGNIAHWGAGLIPKRPSLVNSYTLLDGTTSVDEPIGYYTFDENPHLENPESGFLASANNAPLMDGFEEIRGYFCPPNRVNRVITHLEGQERWSQEEMKSIHKDVISDEHVEIVKSMLINFDETKLDEIQKSAFTVLLNWEGNYDLEAIGPVIFTKLLYHVMHGAMADEIGDSNFKILQRSYIYKGALARFISNGDNAWWDNLATVEKKENKNEIIGQAFEKTIKELKIQLGEDVNNWKWKKVHHLTHEHPLGKVKPLDKWFNVGPFPVTGGNDVPNKMMYTYNSDGVYPTTSSPALRILLDFDNIDASESINPTGQSGNVMSPHYKDQAIMFNNGEYRPQLMQDETIKKSKKRLLLK